ncbi:hypothetical protein SELMODRAFT_431319 [Selaginella moellendorffii]|uniref:EKC/KEOPS complex subunit CGI121 n=1 Tax=Selaginella moellendorffii TaxID=88036 RepID=D8TC75_SELML|nr:EKC/KEOPS complex subunit TPRKB [Selaginella moellendorffii]EFJ05709.1 hypothetical protein SELMODRAFT_431319 [Selaginella moellendorffii]|eukprot:XP_002993189.1 EKC/KEOPS complex subunit TPRKB [Selaginella moellendorffii]
MEVPLGGGRALRFFLFDGVSNSGELLASLQAGTLSPEVALFNASLVPDLFPVLASAHRTLLSQSRGNLVTRTLHSELVYNFSGSKHITESLRRCGISSGTSYVLVVQFDCPAEKENEVRKLIQGREISLEELAKRADTALIQKHFKVPPLELEISSLTDAVTSRIAARDAL